MVAYAMHLLRTTDASEVRIHPDGEHGKQFDFSRWLSRRGFSMASRTGTTTYGGSYKNGDGWTVIIKPKSGEGDVAATVGDQLHSAECKGGIIKDEASRSGVAAVQGPLRDRWVADGYAPSWPTGRSGSLHGRNVSPRDSACAALCPGGYQPCARQEPRRGDRRTTVIALGRASRTENTRARSRDGVASAPRRRCPAGGARAHSFWGRIDLPAASQRSARRFPATRTLSSVRPAKSVPHKHCWANMRKWQRKAGLWRERASRCESRVVTSAVGPLY